MHPRKQLVTQVAIGEPLAILASKKRTAVVTGCQRLGAGWYNEDDASLSLTALRKEVLRTNVQRPTGKGKLRSHEADEAE